MKELLKILIALFSVFLCCCNSSESDEKLLYTQIHLSLQETDSIQPFNGVVGVLKKGQKPLIIYHGHTSPIQKTGKLNSEDYFYLASNSKLFTGLASLKLMEQYKLKPTDSIGPYFPELHPLLGKVTIQQLANHTNAIHDYLSLTKKPVRITNKEAFMLLSQLDSTVYQPGIQWAYTNSGYLLMSLLIERVSQKNYNDYLSEEILLPLGIRNAVLHPDTAQSLNGFENNQQASIVSLTTGDAGIYLKVDDLIHFFENQDNIRNYTEQAEQWSSPWREEEWRYGFGWFFSRDSLGKFRAHSGRSSGFESYIRIYDSNELMIFILSNHVNGSAKLLREKIINQVLEYENKAGQVKSNES